jgi:hypothetical protein
MAGKRINGLKGHVLSTLMKQWEAGKPTARIASLPATVRQARRRLQLSVLPCQRAEHRRPAAATGERKKNPAHYP